MTDFHKKLFFMLKYKTFKLVARDPNNPNNLIFLSNGKEKNVSRLCPHQGAPLDQYSRIEKGELVCMWHGCRFKGVSRHG